MSIAVCRPKPSAAMSAFFAAAFFVNGVVIPFFPVVLTARGLSAGDVALVLGLPYLLRLVSLPLVTRLADRAGDRRRVVAAVCGLVLALGLAFLPLAGRLAVIGTATAVLVLLFCIGPLADAVALSLERRGAGVYGRMRLWGSASFILGNLAGGAVLHRGGADAVYLLMLAGFAIALAATAVLPPPGPLPKPATAAAAGIVRRPAFVAVLVAGALMQASHAGLYGFATLTWRQRGFGDDLIGAFWAIGVVAEIVLFALAHRIPARVSPVMLLVGCGLVGVLRWALFTIDTDAATTAAAQLLHAGTFALGHYGTMRFIREMVPEERAASAQGLYGTAVGVGMAAATAVAGRLWERFGDDGFLGMSAFAGAGVVILVLARTRIGRLGGTPAAA
ncbi:MFS transporter [Oharaeibacter diazotrophicus]|uniref:PPP family 3-phenylpropionic acid transporter n=1 Tax=Oharaeibacter diazotrophicus TaxID=1920512 RepID=A0A4R6RNN3_9HYPH|nr:MFS transporter [Oharaeibacter diazotrophicus]TDP87677.1 PPP family 3-phenylpropionic acid transporter [Oharaeibacter diazotrophicus]BBE74740.1 putative 3-phenylpropionic acid transporter [Pleomorphomonas sp. SM30]GLS77122.1 MFS transporter [Oharaeibacter diazotrophicus]